MHVYLFFTIITNEEIINLTTVSWELFVHIYEVHEMFCVWGTMVENSTNSQEGFFFLVAKSETLILSISLNEICRPCTNVK